MREKFLLKQYYDEIPEHDCIIQEDDFKDSELIEEEYDRFDPILRNKREDIAQALNSIDYKFLFVMAHTGKRGAASTILYDMQQWQRELNEAASLETITPNHELPFQVHLVSSEDITQWRHAQTSATVDLEDILLPQCFYPL